MTEPRRRRGAVNGAGPAVAAIAMGLAILVVPACGVSPTKAPVSPCFRVLPRAHDAVGGQGSFVDVVRISGGGVSRFSRRALASGAASDSPAKTSAPPPTTANLTPTTIDPRSDICVVAYGGTFDPTRIPLLVGPARSGKYAIVVVGVRTQRVRAVALTDRLPAPLRRH